jgi:ATP-binding protein involved in chromosome partitioning
MLDAALIRKALGLVLGPDGTTPLTESGAMSDIIVRDGGKVLVSIAAQPEAIAAWAAVRDAAEAAVKSVPGVTAAMVTLTAERAAPATGAGSVSGQGAGQREGSAPRAAGAAIARPPLSGAAAKPTPARLAGIAEVAHIVAVASGKGGVGKSTTACNLALGLRALGLKVGVLDADIYGPSMPKLFALKGSPEIVTGRTLKPLEAYGCKVMSMGFVVDADKAMIWRGPMVASAITQMMRDVAWGPLDVLVVDMPPGTGDAQLTLAQQTPLSGAVIVSTPQDLALIDARRGVAMFQDVKVPILGIIENMSYFVCDGCGKRHDIFAHGGARAEAAKLGVPFLGEIPLDMEIRERSDAGLPIVVTAPDGAHAGQYKAIARAVWGALTKKV